MSASKVTVEISDGKINRKSDIAIPKFKSSKSVLLEEIFLSLPLLTLIFK